MATLPENLVATIKRMNETISEFTEVVNQFKDLSNHLNAEMDKLVTRHPLKLDTIDTDLKSVVKLPRAIVPNPPLSAIDEYQARKEESE